MGFFKDAEVVVAKVVPPTLDQQLDHAERASQLALEVFQQAVRDLERAAETFDNIAAESQVKAEAHALRAESADEAAAANRARAETIRNLLG